MLRSLAVFRVVVAVSASAIAALVPGTATALTISATVGVDAFATQVSPGVSRSTTSASPLADTGADIVGLNTATAFASVDAFGLHASAAVHADDTNGSLTASARAIAGLTNEFMIVPRAGFTGTHALVRIPYSFGGAFNTTPSLQGCPTCAAGVQAQLGVDGMAGQGFSFLGSHSLGTVNNPSFVAGGVSMGGMLEGLLPVNTTLYLRAGLIANAHCQGLNPTSCSAEALFSSTLSYAGFSPDEVDIVWGLTPTLAPEPAPAAFLAIGILGLALAGRRRGERREG